MGLNIISPFPKKIIVMDSGNIVQAGNPKELFERPQTTFVGYFIGSPAMNIYDCTALSDFDVSISGMQLKTSTNLSNVKSEQLKIGIRSEFIKLVNDRSDNTIEAKIEIVEDFGNYKLITVNKNCSKRLRALSEFFIFFRLFLTNNQPSSHCVSSSRRAFVLFTHLLAHPSALSY